MYSPEDFWEANSTRFTTGNFLSSSTFTISLPTAPVAPITATLTSLKFPSPAKKQDGLLLILSCLSH